jgi:hypothetical protein
MKAETLRQTKYWRKRQKLGTLANGIQESIEAINLGLDNKDFKYVLSFYKDLKRDFKKLDAILSKITL